MTRTDVEAIDELCRLALAARRLDCRIHLAGVGADLRGLLELVARAGDVLAECPRIATRADSGHTGGDLR